jgi:hypothetical protein
MIRALLTIFCIVLLVQPSAAQEHQNTTVPEGWQVRLDHPDADATISANQDSADIFFVDMAPGWHITTGPAAIFWHPKYDASGTYRATSTIHLFDPNGRNEAFGMFIGGKNLDQSDQQYTYFLLRNSGQYLIKKRIGDETEVIQNWTSTPAMRQWTSDGGTSVPNTLSIEAGPRQVRFFVNGEQVHVMAREQIDANGIAGIRINHALNVHVEELLIEEI